MTDTVLWGYFDGECRGNEQSDPAKRAMRVGYVIGDTRYTAEAGHPIPSNNVAEYMALIQLLDHIYTKRPEFQGLKVKKYVIAGDSQLVINQMAGAWKVRHPSLLPLRDSARVYVVNLVHVQKLDIEFRWVPREGNLAGKLLEATK